MTDLSDLPVSFGPLTPAPITYEVVTRVTLDQADAQPVDLSALNAAVLEQSGVVGSVITEAVVRPGCHTDASTVFNVTSGLSTQITSCPPAAES